MILKVADGTVVGANAVLKENTEVGFSYVGVPAHSTGILHKVLSYGN